MCSLQQHNHGNQTKLLEFVLDAQRGDLKLFDFGMARKLCPTDAGLDGLHHHLSHMTGSLRYMAPEVALGKPYHQGCDVYSFSVVWWEILALERPYQSVAATTTTEAAFLKRVAVGGHRPKIPRAWPSRWKPWFQAGWADHPLQRCGIRTLHLRLRGELVRLRQGDESGLEHRKRRSTYVFDPQATAAVAAGA